MPQAMPAWCELCSAKHLTMRATGAARSTKSVNDLEREKGYCLPARREEPSGTGCLLVAKADEPILTEMGRLSRSPPIPSDQSRPTPPDARTAPQTKKAGQSARPSFA